MLAQHCGTECPPGNRSEYVLRSQLAALLPSFLRITPLEMEEGFLQSFTAPHGDATRKRVDMDFDIRKVPISVPRFGEAEYDATSDPFIVNFRNAAKHALEVSRSGESVGIALFRPKISYESNGMIEGISCGIAQVLPDRLVKKLHGGHKQ